MKDFIFNTFFRLILFLAFTLAITVTSCSSNTSANNTIKPGHWRGMFYTQGQEIPITIEAETKAGNPVLYLVNGDERLLLNKIEHIGDSLKIGMHIFDADLIVKVTNDQMQGRFVKNDTKTPYAIPFKAEFGKKYRFKENPAPAAYNFEGKWEVIFSDEEGDSTEAIGVFQQQQNKLTGTFLTKTGDYRYLEGLVEGTQMQLSGFNGSNLYLFTATPTNDSTLLGRYYSGLTGNQTWIAKRNPNAKLPDANTLTYLKEGYEKLSFSFPDLDGNNISLSDQKYQNKVVIVQLLGSWCPNCMDETKYLAPYYDKNKARGLEIIGLGFERSPDFDVASKRLKLMQERLDVNYDLLVAGTTDKGSAAEALPALNHVMSFPTTIFIGRDGNVRKIHTGFSGPSTGTYYEEWVAELKKTMDELLAEE